MKDSFSTEYYFKKLNSYWRAANYVSLAQLYLLNNPLLRRKLTRRDIKQKIVGHWGTVPGQNFVYAHCNRVITKYNLNMILVSGPGHGGNFFVANSYLEGTYSEVYPEITQDEEGLKKLCKQFSFPGGISSHVSPEVPGSINEGGELGYSLAHAFGAVLDNKNLIATAIVGDGEAETGTLATSWHLNKFINPHRDGVVLPILHLNGYKISNPTILSRMPENQLKSLFEGYGYKPYFVEGDDPNLMHKLMAKTMDKCILDIQNIKKSPLSSNIIYPMIILRTPKGWTCPKSVDNLKMEGTFRAHQVPISMQKDGHLKLLQKWLLSYKPNELFDKDGKLAYELKNILPKGDKRMSANPITNGGLLMKDIKTPKVEDYLLKFKKPCTEENQDTLELSNYIRDLYVLNKNNYRIFSPDEAMSNRFHRVFDVEKRSFNTTIMRGDENLSVNGRIMDSFLSENVCEGMLEGYLLTGRHGMFNSYEAFIRIVDSMVTQHIKWLKTCSNIEWRAPISSLNLILTSNCWQQDHNGFTHQDPGFLDHLSSKNSEFVRMYLPPDTNTLLYTFDKCTKSKNLVNAIVASKHPRLQWFTQRKAKQIVEKGLGIVDFACLNDSSNPDVVIVSCGDTANLEALATITLIKEYLPKLNVRFVNVIDLLKLLSSEQYSEGLTDEEYDEIFTKDKPIIFNFHGYGRLIHQLTYNRHNQNLHVQGYCEQGTITTPFDMRVNNKVDRFHLLLKVIKYVKLPKAKVDEITKAMEEKLQNHYNYIRKYGVDMPEITEWRFK